MMGVFDSIELRMLRRADYVPTLFPTQVYVLTAFRGCEHVSLWGAYALSYRLLSLAFATRWNQKHPSYVSIQLFFKNGMDSISVILTKTKFQTGMRFSCEHNLPETKWISTESLMLRLIRMCVWNSVRVWISYRSFWQKISCRHNPK